MSGSKRANERRERLTKNSYHDPVRGERRAGRPSQARSGDTPTTRGGEDSPESIARTIPTAYKPSSDARATPWPRVKPGSKPAPSGCRPSDTQPHVACMGVETIASRAVISLYLLIRRYSKRHGLHRPREVGRRAAGRCASGGRAANHVRQDQRGKGVKWAELFSVPGVGIPSPHCSAGTVRVRFR